MTEHNYFGQLVAGARGFSTESVDALIPKCVNNALLEIEYSFKLFKIVFFDEDIVRSPPNTRMHVIATAWKVKVKNAIVSGIQREKDVKRR